MPLERHLSTEKIENSVINIKTIYLLKGYIDFSPLLWHQQCQFQLDEVDTII